MFACLEISSKTSGRAGFMADHRASGLGFVLSVTGSRAEVRLYAGDATANHDESRVTIGKLIAVRTPTSAVVGVVARLSGPESASGEYHPSDLTAEVDFLGEVVQHGTPEAYFQRGVSEYPAVGDKVMALDTEDISVIHHIDGGETINVGRLKMDAKVPAYINFDELLQKHFAVLGTTGVGKSSAVALILREILKKKANLRIFLIDPHNEYGHCFGDMANLINERMGKLENRSSWMKYHRLITRIETLGQDSRYAFMFDSLMVEDMMSKVLADLFRLP